jgi:uncharacterized protein (DUF1697 family)
MRFVALVRAINVGGRNKVPMAELRADFEAAGATDVATYIQSGNVVFSASRAKAKKIGQTVSETLSKRLGAEIPVLIRSRDDLATVVNELPWPDAEPKQLHVGYLAAPPAPEAIAALDPMRSPPDRFEVRDRVIYLWLPNGVGKTKLNGAYLDRKLGTPCTIRNWRTTLKLLDLAT